MKLLIPISYFFGMPRSEIWELDTHTDQRNCIIALPMSPHPVSGKGITGLCWLDDEHLVACDFNRVLLIDRTSSQITKEYFDTSLNDLHSVSLGTDSILLANTGRDSIVKLDFQLRPAEEFDGLSKDDWVARRQGLQSKHGSYYETDSAALPFHQRKIQDQWHLNHVLQNSALENRIIATSFTKRCLIDVQTWKSVSNQLEFNPHDGVIDGGFIWITTVNGDLFRSSLALPLNFKLVISLFKYAPFQGWCRGLLITADAIYVGITQLYEKNSRTSWLTECIEKTRSGIYRLSKDTFDIEQFYDFTQSDGTRIFSLLADNHF
jgi:hypothetical protein